MHLRAFMEVAAEIQYTHLKRLRIWKGGIADEGVRFVCKYLTACYSLELIDLLDNNLTPLSCEFIGKSLVSPHCRLQQLKLDNNLIRTIGLGHLAIGLRQNNVIDKLSLKYCGI